jgi:hypothetical protein
MTDDFVTDGILPEESTSDDDEFDPDALGSDDFLDDVEEEIDDVIDPLDETVVPPEEDDEEDELLEEEIE